MSRERTYWTRVTNAIGVPMKKCSHCAFINRSRVLVCRSCDRVLVRRRRTQRPPRGSMDRLQLELAHAEKMADTWARKVTLAVSTMSRWRQRERRLAARLAAGPQPKRPRREKPPRRGIMLEQTVVSPSLIESRKGENT